MDGPIAFEVASAVARQLTSGKVFQAPFVKPYRQRAAAKPVVNPAIEADRIAPPWR